MKSLMPYFALCCMILVLMVACSMHQESPTAPNQPSACQVQPRGLNKALASAEWKFVGGPNGPQPLKMQMARFVPSGDSLSPKPIPVQKSLWYGDCDEVTCPGTPDSWTAWNCTIDMSTPDLYILYSEVGNRSSPTSCRTMTLHDSRLWWRPYPFTGKWQVYAVQDPDPWIVFNDTIQIISGAYGRPELWESRCTSYHVFEDYANKPSYWEPPML